MRVKPGSTTTCYMAEGKEAEIVHWIHSVEQARRLHILGPPEEISDWGLTSNPDVKTTHGSLSSVHSPTLDVTVSHTPSSQSPFLARTPLTHSHRTTHATERPELHQRAGGEMEKMARETQKVIWHSRQKSLSPLPDPLPSLKLPTFNPEEGHPKPLRRRTTFTGSPQPKSKLIHSRSSPYDLEAKSAPVSPNLSANRKPPLDKATAFDRQKSYSQEDLPTCEVSSFSSEGAESLEEGSLKSERSSSDYNVSPVHSSSAFQYETEGSPPPPSGVTAKTTEPTFVAGYFTADGTEKQADCEERALPALKQQELAMLSVFVGSKLPQLTLLLGLRYSDYENVRATERSLEGQALEVLMRWYQSGKGERQELADALKMAGHGRIAKLLLHGELENLYKEEEEATGREVPSPLLNPSSHLRPPSSSTRLSSPPESLERCEIRLHSPLERCELSPPGVPRLYHLSGARAFTFDNSKEPSTTTKKYPPRHVKFLSKQLQPTASMDQTVWSRIHSPSTAHHHLSSLYRRFSDLSSTLSSGYSGSSRTFDIKSPDEDIRRGSMLTEELIRRGTQDVPDSNNPRAAGRDPIPPTKPSSSVLFPERTAHPLFKSHHFRSPLQPSQERALPLAHSHQLAWSHASKEPDRSRKDLVNRQDSGLGTDLSTASAKFDS